MKPFSLLPEGGKGSDPHLLEEIRQRIHSHGPISFAEYMDLALYHPQWGYYARSEDPVGPADDRDYFTAPTRSAAFGSLVGRQVAECLQKVGGSGREWVELGPGGGDLAVPVLQNLRDRGAARPASGIRCTLVESSPYRRESQARRLRERDLAEGVLWRTPQEWLEEGVPVRGCLVANEILDAMPVHRLVYRDGGFQEVLVDWRASPVEILAPVSSAEVLEQAIRDCPAPREGQELEVGLAALKWLRRLAGRLERGYIIFLDYGYLAPEMYSLRHHRGTLLAYHRHTASEAYLRRVGRQDLTAHVNFSSLLEIASACGLQARGPVSQGHFLLALGALDWFADSGEDVPLAARRGRKALQTLFLPGGMGESHQVIVLGTAGLDMDLTGLRPQGRWPIPRSS